MNRKRIHRRAILYGMMLLQGYVLGPETHGRVRGLGFGATLSRVNAAIQGSGRVKELEAIVDFQAQRFAQIEAKLDSVLNFN